MDNPTEKKIIEISNELKTRNLIDPGRIIIPSETAGFKASVYTSNTICFDPNASELDDNEIRFCLLHEEGHLTRWQYGFQALLVLLVLGMFPIIYLILSPYWDPSKKVSTDIWIIYIFFTLFAVFSSMRILTQPFQWDEYGSDEFATKILHDNYGIKKPSEILKNALIKTPSKFDRSYRIIRLFIALAKPHPSIIQRVRNIADSIDEK
jgi:Zn-dependent protease with chaperone function